MRKIVQWGLRAAQRSVPIEPGNGVVLAYHLVGAGSRTEVDLDLEAFRRHLDMLTRRVEVVSLEDVLHDGSRLRVALTFDDAFQNFAELVWPELRQRNLPATLFVPTGFIDGEIESPLSGAMLPPCSWDDLRAMSAEGLRCGSHTHLHRNLRRLSASDVEWELLTAKRRIREELDVDAEDFCYPQAKWSRAVKTLVQRHHRRAVIASGRHIRRKVDLAVIPRIPVRRSHRSLEPLLERGVWLEEWVADTIRQYR